MIEILVAILIAVLAASWMIRNKNIEKFETISTQIKKYSVLAIVSIVSFFVGVSYMFVDTTESSGKTQYESIKNNTFILSMFFVLLIVGLFALSSLHDDIKDKEEK